MKTTTKEVHKIKECLVFANNFLGVFLLPVECLIKHLCEPSPKPPRFAFLSLEELSCEFEEVDWPVVFGGEATKPELSDEKSEEEEEGDLAVVVGGEDVLEAVEEGELHLHFFVFASTSFLHTGQNTIYKKSEKTKK